LAVASVATLTILVFKEKRMKSDKQLWSRRRSLSSKEQIQKLKDEIFELKEQLRKLQSAQQQQVQQPEHQLRKALFDMCLK
jgi:hypothetical protein